MPSKDTILCIDIGGGSIRAAEFSAAVEDMTLESFAVSEYSSGTSATDSGEESYEPMLLALKELIETNDFSATEVYVAVSGNDVYIPFVKVPSLTRDPEKIKEIIAFEASQRIPYPINEVAWDYQLITDQEAIGEAAEIDAMLVSVKNSFVSAITEQIESLGKKVKIIECSPTATYNCGRANGVGDTQCEMILNIGAKCSTLIFLDGTRFFMRSIPTAGNTITQQIAKEFNVSFDDAEDIKRRHGFVALGGAYEEPESETAATVSKIVRNVMTRLHGEINRSINVYRASQHGRKPEKLYLTGGGSIMAFTPRFFVEKLRMPVDYFNPFKVVAVSPSVDQATLTDIAHLFSEVIGLSIRHIRTTPIEISLIPESILKQRALFKKTPFFYATAAALVAYLGISCWTLYIQAQEIQTKSNEFKKRLESRKATASRVESNNSELQKQISDYDASGAIVSARDNFLVFFNHLQDAVPENVWLTEISFSAKPLFTQATDSTSSSRPQGGGYSSGGGGMRPYGGGSPGRYMPRPGADPADDSETYISGDGMGAAVPVDDLVWLNVKGCVFMEQPLPPGYSMDNKALDCFMDFLDKLRRPEKTTGFKFLQSKGADSESYNPEKYNGPVNVTSFTSSIKLDVPLNKVKLKEKSISTEEAVSE